PTCNEPLDGRVQLVRRNAAEERPPDLCIRPEATPHEDVVRLPPFAALVTRGRALEAEIGDPVLSARVRTSVELQAQVRDLRPEALLQPFDQPAESRLRLGDREVAVRLACARDRASAEAVLLDREADPLDLGDGRVELALGNVRDDEV